MLLLQRRLVHLQQRTSSCTEHQANDVRLQRNKTEEHEQKATTTTSNSTPKTAHPNIKLFQIVCSNAIVLDRISSFFVERRPSLQFSGENCDCIRDFSIVKKINSWLKMLIENTTSETTTPIDRADSRLTSKKTDSDYTRVEVDGTITLFILHRK